MRKTVVVLCFCGALSVHGCQSKLLTTYKIDVQQGNSIEAEAVEKIKLGMSKEQAHFVLGSPLIADSFHPERWDYIYLFTPGNGNQQRRQLTLIFDRDEVIEIIRDNMTISKERKPTATANKQDDSE